MPFIGRCSEKFAYSKKTTRLLDVVWGKNRFDTKKIPFRWGKWCVWMCDLCLVDRSMQLSVTWPAITCPLAVMHRLHIDVPSVASILVWSIWSSSQQIVTAVACCNSSYVHGAVFSSILTCCFTVEFLPRDAMHPRY